MMHAANDLDWIFSAAGLVSGLIASDCFTIISLAGMN